MVHCTASVKFDEESMRRMVKTRMRTFRGFGVYGIFCIGIVMIVLGVLSSYGTLATRTLMIAAGCFLVVGIQTPENYMAKKVVQSMNGQFPKLSYDFGIGIAKIKGADTMNRLEYDDIIRLVEDEDYFYLFLKDKSAFMVEKKSVKPKADSLKELLSEKTGLAFTKPRPIFGISVLSIIMDRKNTKKVKRGRH